MHTHAHSDMALPSYTALKPCALTAKSVVNHKANIDPLLTIGEGSMNPDNLKKKTQSNTLNCGCSGCNLDLCPLQLHIAYLTSGNWFMMDHYHVV